MKKLPSIYEKWGVYCKAVALVPRPWQQIFVYAFFKHREVCWNWCRGSGKTFIMSHLYIFMYLAGLVIDPFWIAAAWAQLNRAQKYWSVNPYIKPFIPSKVRDMVITIDNGVLLFTGATDNNVNGPRGEAVMYDEVSRFDEDVFWNSMPIADHTLFPYRIFSSTPIAFSVFHKLVEEYPTYTQTYLDCPEMNHAAILKRKDTMPDWLWDLNYMCKFSIPEGVVFPYITISHDIQVPINAFICQGVDFGISPGHTLVKIAVWGGKVYIIEESIFKYKTDHDKLKEQCHVYPTEVESGGFNNSFAPYFTGRNISQMPFTGGKEGTKYKRISWLLEQELIINPAACPKTLADMRAARWETTPKGEPKVETESLHNLAALMHAAGHTQPLVDTNAPNRRSSVQMRKLYVR